jgi:hypothetical protein
MFRGVRQPADMSDCIDRHVRLCRRVDATLPLTFRPSSRKFVKILSGGNMDLNRWLRLIAGSFVLATLLLGYYVSPKWYFFTGFVALNLIQSAFTNWCPMMAFLRKLGVKA